MTAREAGTIFVAELSEISCSACSSGVPPHHWPGDALEAGRGARTRRAPRPARGSRQARAERRARERRRSIAGRGATAGGPDLARRHHRRRRRHGGGGAAPAQGGRRATPGKAEAIEATLSGTARAVAAIARGLGRSPSALGDVGLAGHGITPPDGMAPAKNRRGGVNYWAARFEC